MSDRQINETACVLIKAKELIEDEDKWCRGSYGLGGGPVCAVGAVWRVDSSSSAMSALNEAARELSGDPFDLASCFNDQHGHAAVMQMFDRAIEIELQRGAR